MEAPNRLAFQHYFPHAWHLSYIIFGRAFTDAPEPAAAMIEKSRHQKPQNP
ncbi:hypothetical protein [Pseudomonas sp. EL_65y_Pfl2_R96]|uniref:hypothetical protein n=1 Tax=Pseudomonas sp. EL_65y_Pfl2_R96 TaxID=3088699 RepID=UPI0030DC02D4